MNKVVVVALGLLSFSCNKNINTITKDNKAVNSTQIEGKWIDSSNNFKLYIDTELEKIVFSDGCSVISSDFKRFVPAINFTNVVKSQSNCKEEKINVNEILIETVFLQVSESNQLLFLDKNNKVLLILNKNK